MNYKIITRFYDIEKLEKLRKELTKCNSNLSYDGQLLSGSMVAVGAIENDELVGGIYVSDCLSSLYIENIFVKEEYQRRGIATDLLKYVYKNKNIFTDNYTISRLEPNSIEVEEFAKKLGYSKPNHLNVMKKRI